MECSQCWEIVHPACLREHFPDLQQEGVVSDDLPNSWECPKCCRDGKPEQIKPRQLKSGRMKFSDTTSPVQVKASEGVYSNHTEQVNLKQNISISQDTKTKKMTGTADMPPVKKKAKLEITVREESDTSTSEPEMEEMEEESSLASENKDEEEDSDSSPPKQKFRFSEQYKCECTQLKDQSNQTHVRSCAKYPLNMKNNEQKLSDDNHNVQHHLCSISGVTNKEHGETAREQLVRRLKGLEKNLENKQYTTLLEGFKKCEVKVEKIDAESAPRRDKTVTSLQDEGQVDESSSDTPTSKQARDERSVTPHAPRITMTLRNNPNRQKPKRIVKQAPIMQSSIEDRQASKNGSNNLALIKDVMLPVFHYLSTADLVNCQLVCKTWNHWTNDPALWTYINFSHRKITANILMATVQRQPVSLNLSWTNISKHQLSWLIARLLQLTALVLKGCSTAIVSSLCTCYCPLLSSLDISWVEGLTDSFIRKLLASPPDSRPGFGDSKTRLCQLREIRVAGTDVSDISIRLLVHHLSQLSHLDLSHCHKVTDMGIAILGSTKHNQLMALNVSSCANITNTSLEALKQCTKLSYLNMKECPQVTVAACQKFVAQSQQKLMTRGEKLIEKQW
ncbi:jmjC domain-containing histone demethylation protein 1-like [Limulus polyphemus]|uniref:JmjC domain-containing histone demethylation protein 1-like n=1 Tax=Limulus polyphemus TaxID=6850 RepID=A0ABM1BVI4_LIMPO|nr:jmjC domain-containing histone demethylation protein 1-like [Limulus polyphemus]